MTLESGTKFEEKLTCGLENNTGGIFKFSPEHLKVSKLGHWWESFVQSWKYMSLKFTGELCVMTMKNDTNIEEELTCQFKIDLRNLTIFDPSTQRS